MIIDYDHNQNLNTDRKLDSLKESVQMALNENDAEHKGFRALFDKVNVSFDKVNATIESIKESLTKMCNAIGFFKGASISTSYGTAYVNRTFNTITVIFEGSSSAITHSQYTKLFTLSANDKPPGIIRFVGYDNNTSDVTKVPLIGYINTNGECYLWVYGNSGTNVAPRFHVTYVKSGNLT